MRCLRLAATLPVLLIVGRARPVHMEMKVREWRNPNVSAPRSGSTTATCSCTTPNAGTAGHNEYKCTDGTTAFCSSNEVCYATTPFVKGQWASGCSGSNPTHYGPPAGSTDIDCKSDEKRWYNEKSDMVFSFCGKACDHSAADCPTDKPPGATGNVICGEYTEAQVCIIQCAKDSDCGHTDPPLTCGIGWYDAPQCGYFEQPDRCYFVEAISGKWEQIQSSSSNQSVSFEEGVSRSYSVKDTSTWGSKVTTSLKAGFKVFGIGASAEVTGEISSEFSSQYSSTMSMTKTETHSFQYGPGVVWQWRFTVHDGCGKTIGSGHDLALTDGAFDPPCCLPGYFEDITKPHGSCHSSTPDLCKAMQSTSSDPPSIVV